MGNLGSLPKEKPGVTVTVPSLTINCKMFTEFPDNLTRTMHRFLSSPFPSAILSSTWAWFEVLAQAVRYFGQASRSCNFYQYYIFNLWNCGTHISISECSCAMEPFKGWREKEKGRMHNFAKVQTTVSCTSRWKSVFFLVCFLVF